MENLRKIFRIFSEEFTELVTSFFFKYIFHTIEKAISFLNIFNRIQHYDGCATICVLHGERNFHVDFHVIYITASVLRLTIQRKAEMNIY